MFLSKPVPRSLIDEALELAQHAPSNSNIQPWRMVLVSGPALTRLKSALMAEARRAKPQIPPLPEAFRHFRSELGAEVYGKGLGIARSDHEARATAEIRNFEFFGAPLAGIVCMHKDLGPPDALSVGMYLQTLLLALTERRLDTCTEVSVAGYPEILRSELGIDPDLLILCGLAIGYSDEDIPINSLRIGREAVDKSVIFLNE
ncbi:hypothetical protein MMC07_001981 [Pseudocyphellaria aurata]|nr:hypothetical protein [Pseudocyphellaria aurata]